MTERIQAIKPNKIGSFSHTLVVDDTWESVLGIPAIMLRSLSVYAQDGNTSFSLRTGLTATEIPVPAIYKGYTSLECPDLLEVKGLQVKGPAGKIIIGDYKI